ncbi:MAG: hypothetical protein U0637_05360 [Phycisphaerales bacterium]
MAYDNLSNGYSGSGFGYTSLHDTSMVLEDIGFADGPWDGAVGRVVTDVSFALAISETNQAADGPDFVLVFWSTDDVDYGGVGGAGTNMINPGATPLAVLRFEPVASAGSYYVFTATGLQIAIPDAAQGVFVQFAWVDDGFQPAHWSDAFDESTATGVYQGCSNLSQRRIGFCSNSQAALGGNAATVGVTSPSYGRDISSAAACASIGVLVGNGAGPEGDGSSEHRVIAASPQRGCMIRLKGTHLPPPAPTPRDNLGCLSDAGLHVSGVLGSESVAWYEMCLPGPVTDLQRRFLDIDTEGTAVMGGDVAIALYGANGDVSGIVGGVATAVDDGSGSGTDDQLSFGVGRRGAPGDGLAYDGRNGELEAGTYYLVVAPRGSVFLSRFRVGAGTQPGGVYTLRVTTNVVGGALAPTAVPIINGQDFGVLSDATIGASLVVPPRGVLWHRFVIDEAVSASGHVFLDLLDDLQGGLHPNQVFLFDDGGDLVASCSGSANSAQRCFLSFGCTDSPPRTHGDPGLYYDGQEGELAAGTYYLAVGIAATTGLGTNPGRFHLRATNGATHPVRISFFRGACAACDGVDFNNDGMFPDALDVQDFLVVFAGGPCSNDPFCGDIDFNNDGLFPDTLDIGALLSVFAGGECLR